MTEMMELMRLRRERDAARRTVQALHQSPTKDDTRITEADVKRDINIERAMHWLETAEDEYRAAVLRAAGVAS